MFRHAGLVRVARLGAVLGVAVGATLLSSGPALAAGTSATVTPARQLTNNEVVTVRGSGYTPGAPVVIVQCNRTTVTTHEAACNLSNIVFVTANKEGRVPATPFTVKTGTIGNGKCVTSKTPIANNKCFIEVANEAHPFKQVAGVAIVFKN